MAQQFNVKVRVEPHWYMCVVKAAEIRHLISSEPTFWIVYLPVKGNIKELQANNIL